MTRRLLEQALDLPPGERDAFVAREAPTPEAAARVLAMIALEADDGAHDDPGAPLAEYLNPGSQLLQPERLGPWDVRERIGRGGMADVWLAVRADGTYRRRVAIKKLHPGLADREVVARFERERQILASLSHPGISKMLGAGTSIDGTPYIVMELVDGQRVDAYADERHLSLRERVQLVVDVADAVMAAHRMHIVHRDIKPSNVLVDIEGRPTLLDFGIAKVLDPEKNTDSLLTLDSNRYLTPNYASPEQMQGHALRATSDVYSLGVLTFELLVGSPPLQLSSVSTADALTLSASTEAPSPSEGFAKAPARKDLATKRGVTTAQLTKALKDRDLEAVLEAALRKEPARRPPDAGAFRDELQRWLAGETVHSRKDGPVRKVWRRVCRNKTVSGLTAALVLATVVGYVSSWTEARRAQAANARLLEQTAVAESRLNDLRDSMRVLLVDSFESLSGIPGTEHAVDRILRRGISIAERQADPVLQMHLGQALVRKAQHWIRRTGPTPAAVDELLRGYGLMCSGLQRFDRTVSTTSAGFALDAARYLSRLGDPVAARAAWELGTAELRIYTPRDDQETLDAAMAKSNGALALAYILKMTGQFSELNIVVAQALLDLDVLRKAEPSEERAAGSNAVLLAHSPEYQRGRIRAMEGNFLALIAGTRQFAAMDPSDHRFAPKSVTAHGMAGRLLKRGSRLADLHGANRVVDAGAVSMQLHAAELLITIGELDEGRAVYTECMASLPDRGDAAPQLQEIITYIVAIQVRSMLCALPRNAIEMDALALDAADLANAVELHMSPSFYRTRCIADLILIAGRAKRWYGPPSSALTHLTRAYTLYEGLAETSPEHFQVAVGRCEAALALHEVLESDPSSDLEWLTRAQAHYDALPGDEAALRSVEDFAGRLYSALGKR